MTTGPPTDLARAALGALRHRTGKRRINWTPHFMGFGNQLYLWCWAWERREQSPRPMVLVNERTRPWLPEVPGFAARFLLERHEVSFWDDRADYWADKVAISGHAQGFSPRARHDFITGALVPEPLLAGVADSPLSGDRSLTLVVRRGDFYEGAWNRSQFAMDVRAYLAAAVPRAIDRDGAVDRIHVISDDLAWCREHLGFLGDHAEVTHPSSSDGPAEHFRQACGSRRLVITNGTFCVWAAFISRTVHDQDPGLVWAPAFFQRSYGPGRCVEYDHDFSFVDDLPQGWQPEWVLADP